MAALLQQGIEHLAAHLCCIFRACLERGYIPKAWRQVRVTFISKPRKTNYTESTAYYLINLSSLILKTIGKLLDRSIRDEILSFYPLHQNQFAYLPTKQLSPLTLPCAVVTHIENTVEHMEIAHGACVDT